MKKTLIITFEESDGKFEIQNVGFNRMELIGALHLQMEMATKEYVFISKQPAPPLKEEEGGLLKPTPEPCGVCHYRCGDDGVKDCKSKNWLFFKKMEAARKEQGGQNE